ncbi:hypothetical protein [Kribbella sp. NPDC023855]|uniref:hypothetical protein n=1 Tax=Kribbella sp. NPDC023855 TaxID=3154698 RepID=UPI003400DD7E
MRRLGKGRRKRSPQTTELPYPGDDLAQQPAEVPPLGPPAGAPLHGVPPSGAIDQGTAPAPPAGPVERRRHVTEADLEALLGEVLGVIVQWSERQGHAGVPPQLILGQLNALTQAYGTALRPEGR